MAYERSVGRGFSKVGFLTLVAFLGVLLAVAPAFAQRGMSRMQGTVRDAAGSPVAGVTIVISNPDVVPSRLETTTDEQGEWVIPGLKANTPWLFSFTKDGYLETQVRASVGGERINPDMDVTLVGLNDDAGAGSVDDTLPGVELFTAGNAAMEAGDPATAAAKYEEFLALNPDSHLVYGNLGNAYRDAGDPEKARAAYQKLLDVEPDNTMANYNIGELLIGTGEIDEAIGYFETVVAAAPDDPAVYYNVAELYFSERQMEQAIQYYLRALEVDPNFLSAYAQLGFANVNVGDIPAAIAAFEKYVEIAPEDDSLLPVIKDVLAALQGSTL